MNEELKKKLQLKSGKLQAFNIPSQLTPTFNTDEEDITGYIFFIQYSKDIGSIVIPNLGSIQNDNLCWIAYPKKTGKVETDLSRDEGWEKISSTEWVPVRQISIDEDWSALRFRKKDQIKDLKRGKDYPGIDSKAKTVEIPTELKQVLDSSSLLEEFENLSFTRRKEYVISILDAKKPETRIKRIQKIIEDLKG